MRKERDGMVTDCIDLPENDLKSIVQAYVSILFENQNVCIITTNNMVFMECLI